MTSRRVLVAVAATFAIAAACAAVGVAIWRPAPELPTTFSAAGRPARIVPDYADCWLPPNICPISFRIEEAGAEYRVHAHADACAGFVVGSRGASVSFPSTPWRNLLDGNRGGQLRFDVYVRQAGAGWRKFDSIVSQVAAEDIDPYVAYRLLGPIQVLSSNMGTYQRELSTYVQTPILESKEGSSRRCVNCHTFANNDPDSMVLHLRGAEGTALLVARNGRVSKVDTRRSEHAPPGSYGAWHPNAKLVALSFSAMVQFFHTAGNRRDVFMFDSDLGVLSVESNRVIACPAIADPDYVETFPCWSADGKALIFSRTKRQWTDRTGNEGPVPPVYKDVRFDLMRIAFDPDTCTWGDLETVLAADRVGLSIVEPRVSPDNRTALVTMTDYGCFPIFRDSSDLYFVDLNSGAYRPLSANSPESDSWHSWSRNGRWIVFASKRETGVFSRLFFSYVDRDGRDQKPFPLPQKNPDFYDALLDNFNAPEFAVKPVGVNQREFLRAIYRTSTLPVKSDLPDYGLPNTAPAYGTPGAPPAFRME
ncbi:MAG: hypothetical protein FJ276_09075 [Planctomycetes bacterium]|nr:hypothetical protein [Planctomycetota bacterium]